MTNEASRLAAAKWRLKLEDCNNTSDFRELARRRLPGPVFHYIDGAADDEVTRRRNTESYEACDLVPNVLAGVADIDMSTTVMGRKIAMPLFLSPTAAAKWVTEARKGKGKSSALILGGTGHFEVIAPGSPVWSQVEAFLLEQLKVEK